MSKKFVVSVAVVLLLLSIGAVYRFKNIATSTTVLVSSEPQEYVHYHAAFHHYKDGVLQDYSDFSYMSVKPCSLDDDDHEDDPLEQVHLHDGNGEVVHVHASGITWRNLFQSLGVDLSDPVLYINGEVVENGLDQVIGGYERTLILENTGYSESLLSQVPSIDDIKEAESSSELCGV